jgi:hypothetical protein
MQAGCSNSKPASGVPAALATSAECHRGAWDRQALLLLVHKANQFAKAALEFRMAFRRPLQLVAGVGDAIIQTGGRKLGPMDHG